MNKIDFSFLGGYPLAEEDLDFLQNSYSTSFSAIAQMIGDKVIMCGMNLLNGSVSSGWISLNNEIIPFLPGAIGNGNFDVIETSQPLVFNDGQMHEVMITRVAQFSNTGLFQYTDLVRLLTIKDAFTSFTNFMNAKSDDPELNDTHILPTTVATKTLADRIGNKIIKCGSFTVGDVPATDGIYTITHNANVNGYLVAGSLRSIGADWNQDNDVIWMVKNLTANSFSLLLREVSANTQNLVFDYILIKI